VHELTYLQALIIGALQGVTELFPVSSLGHSVLLPAWLGGDWEHLVTESATQTSEGSPYLAFVVALHVATAAALLVYYRSDWIRIIGAFFRTLRTRKAETSSERLAWLIVIATIPVGLTGLVLEHTFRTLFAKPLAAAIFLCVNALILAVGERLRRRAETVTRHGMRQTVSVPPAGSGSDDPANDGHVKSAPAMMGGLVVADRRRLDTLSYREGFIIGAFQTLALLAGISRSGITMVGGLVRGLDHEDAAKFAFLLATPVILAAGVLKIPTLLGPAGAQIHGQVIAGSLIAGVAAYLAVRFLTRYFTTRSLLPFAAYCLLVGVASIIRFA
jgi:undecaprenyl-diphosphatase